MKITYFFVDNYKDICYPQVSIGMTQRIELGINYVNIESKFI